MRRVLPQVLLVAVVAVAWVAAAATAASNAINTTTTESQIEEAEELGTYKTVLSQYDQMIREYPDDITWRVRKADAYYSMGANNNYITTCEAIIEAFPDDPTGYLKLMEYYAETSRVEKLIEIRAKAPEVVQADESISNLYGEHEYDFKVISAQYGKAGQFQGDYAVVQLDGFYGYAGATGSIEIQCDYDEARPFIGERAAVKKDGEWFLIDAEGDRVAASHDQITNLYSPNDGLALAEVDGAYGYYDADLKNPSHFEYENATGFANGVAAVKKNGKWALIDTSFNELTGFQFDEVITDFAGFATRQELVFAKKDGAVQLFDLSGARVGNQSFEDAHLFYGDFAAVKQGGKWGFINQSGELVISCQFDNAESFSKDIGAVEKNGSWGFVDKAGEMVVEPQFKGAFPISEKGISPVSLGETMRYIQFYKYMLEGE